jgi:ABC-2 type transport system ATP-binding protein
VTEPLLRLMQVSRTYADHCVLAPLDVEVHPGRVVAVTGDNGSGKSTLLRLATGRDKPSTGEIQFTGGPLADENPQQRQRMAVCLGAASFYPDLSVRDHLELVALSHGLGAEAEDRVETVMSERGLLPLADRMPASLSSGQLQSMLLASALVRPFDLLVLDEPEQRLDAGARIELATTLNAVVAGGAGILLASHDPMLVEAVADEVIQLADGEVTDRRKLRRHKPSKNHE